MSNEELGSGEIETTASTEQPTTFNPSTPINIFECLRNNTCPGLNFPDSQQFSTPKPRYLPPEVKIEDTQENDEGMKTTYIVMIAGGFVLGCLVGIITTMLIYNKRRRRPRLPSSRWSSRNAKVQKNPKEQTFEPLDLSLNQSRISHVQTPDTPRRVIEDRRDHVDRASQSIDRNVITQLNSQSPSYLNFEPPTPPSLTGSHESDETDQPGSTGRRVTLPQVKCIDFHNFNISDIKIDLGRDVEQAKSGQIVQQDSFSSSGRGTGIETNTSRQNDPPNNDICNVDSVDDVTSTSSSISLDWSVGNTSSADATSEKEKNKQSQVIKEQKVDFVDENVLSSYLGLKGFSTGKREQYNLSKADSVDSGHHSTIKNHCSVQTETEDETIQL